MNKLELWKKLDHTSPAFIAASREAVPILIECLEKALDALQFYGDEENYDSEGAPGYNEPKSAQGDLPTLDFGDRAESALKEIRAKLDEK